MSDERSSIGGGSSFDPRDPASLERIEKYVQEKLDSCPGQRLVVKIGIVQGLDAR